jgi:hypothetical protein
MTITFLIPETALPMSFHTIAVRFAGIDELIPFSTNIRINDSSFVLGARTDRSNQYACLPTLRCSTETSGSERGVRDISLFLSFRQQQTKFLPANFLSPFICRNNNNSVFLFERLNLL